MSAGRRTESAPPHREGGRRSLPDLLEDASADFGRFGSSNRVEIVPFGLIEFHGNRIVGDLGVDELEERSVDVLAPEVSARAGAGHFRVRGEETVHDPVIHLLIFKGARPDRRPCCVWVPRRRATGFHLAGIGTLDPVLMSPREIFRTAILKNASAVVVAHSHPSGDPRPSESDIRATR